MAFDAEERRVIARWSRGMSKDVVVKLVCTGDARSGRLESFCDELRSLAPVVQIVRETRQEPSAPAILMGRSWKYHAAPTGTELEPFLEILSFLSGAGQHVSESSLTQLHAVRLPIDLKIFVSPQCPFCPATVRHLTPLSMVRSQTLITVIDSMLFAEMAESFRIKAVPTVILNDTFRWTGQLRISEILEALEREDPSRLGADALIKMLKAGQADDLADMMLESNRVFPELAALITHPEWSVRLGAMVVVEEIAQSRPDLARSILEPLWKAYDRQESATKGDILYLIGEIGGMEWVPKLDDLLGGEQDAEVRSAAEEARAKLHEGNLG